MEGRGGADIGGVGGWGRARDRQRERFGRWTARLTGSATASAGQAEGVAWSRGSRCLSNIGGKLDMEEPQRFAEYVSGLRGRPKQTPNMFQASLKTLLSQSLADDLEGQIRVWYKIKKTGRSDGSARTYKRMARGESLVLQFGSYTLPQRKRKTLPQRKANGVVKKLEKDESLDWDKYIKENNNILGGNCRKVLCQLGFLSVFAHHYACKNCDDCLASAEN